MNTEYHVAPYVGAWIETKIGIYNEISFMSHPTWVRGLKHPGIKNRKKLTNVAPYVGAWIETKDFKAIYSTLSVAPYVGAWIETTLLLMVMLPDIVSHPTWVRGLKPNLSLDYFLGVLRRTLRGCVD